MSTNQTSSSPFGELLKQHRLAARLTQTELAERAHMSEHSISNLERGAQHAPRKDTVRLLSVALHLSPAEEALFSASAQALRRPRAAPTSAAAALAFAHPATPLIGRDNEIAAISAMLQTDQIRLLTLTGMGGVGKTHLALEVANRLSTAFGARRTFVDLARISSPELVIPAIARALEIRESSSRTLLASIQARLQQCRWLLLLDNYEHLLPASRQIAELFAPCSHLSVLVTSRSALQVRGEHLYTLHPLTLPDSTQEASPATLALVPAVALFVARAQALQPDFTLTEANAAAISAICRRLDGLPLAIELAAARLLLLSPDSLLARLDHRLSLLTQGANDLPARQRALRATLAWSYDLLSCEEQALFRSLAVFAGGADLPAIERVCQMDAGSVLDTLTTLMTHHLLQNAATKAGEPRVRMLETVREYAWEQLLANCERAEILRSHATYYLELAERAGPALKGPQQVQWLQRLDEEYENLRAALSWTLEQQEVEMGLRLAGALGRFWYQRGLLSEGRAWLERLLALHAPDDHSLWRAEALYSAGWLAFGQGDYLRAKDYHHASLDLSRALNHRPYIAHSLNNLGGIARMEGDYARARNRFEESLALYRELDDTFGISAALNNLAATAWEQGDYARAQTLGEESLALDRAAGNLNSAAIILEGLGQLALDQGNYARAQTLLEECLVLAHTLSDGRRISRALRALGDALQAQGKFARAAALYQESLTHAQAVEDTAGSADIWQSLGQLALAEGDAERAKKHYRASLALHHQLGARREMAQCLEGLVGASSSGETRADAQALAAAVRLAAAAEVLRKATGAGVTALERTQIEQHRASLRASLEAATFDATWNAGASTPIDMVIAEALNASG